MKRIILISMLITILLSCKTTSKTPVTTAKTDRGSQKEIKGTWQITDVSFPGSDFFKVISFQIAESKCFIGSTWNFIPNNNKGTLSLNSAGCPSFNSPIVWSINKDGSFVLKIVETGTKSKSVTQGYILKVANQSETSFQLIDVVNVGGENKNIVYQFKKMN
jgi:hypothetical protein